jgi:choice-of-anchor A domain-containing protein
MTLKTARKRFALALTMLAAPALMLASSPAMAATLTSTQILDQFNAVVTNNFSTNSDVEGRLVAGNINNSGSSTFYEKPNAQSAASSFKGVNALTIQSCPGCNVNNGGGVDYVTSNAGTFNLNGGGSVAKNSPSFAMSDFTTPLNGLVTQLSALTANSTVNAPNSNSLVFNVAPVNGVAVFTLTAAQLAGLSGTNYNISFLNETSATSIIINVTGGSFSEGGGENFNSDTYLDEHVIWNFEDASNLNFKTWGGAILGEDATVTNTSPLNGFLYAENFTGGGELHDFPFQGGVPEPETWAMMIVGIGGIGLMSRRRRNRAMAAA